MLNTLPPAPRSFDVATRAHLAQLAEADAHLLRRTAELVDQARTQLLATLSVLPTDAAGAWPLSTLRLARNAITQATRDLAFCYTNLLEQATIEAWVIGDSLLPHTMAASGVAQRTQMPIAGELHLAHLASARDHAFGVVAGELHARWMRLLNRGVLGGLAASQILAALAGELRTEAGPAVQESLSPRETMGLTSPASVRLVEWRLPWQRPAAGAPAPGPALSRLSTVARGETMAGFAAANRARQSDLARDVPDLRKWWLSARDDRVRESHADADRQYQPGGSIGPIPVSQSFRVGGSLMVGPHDLSAPVEEWIQCRCVEISVNPAWFPS